MAVHTYVYPLTYKEPKNKDMTKYVLYSECRETVISTLFTKQHRHRHDRRASVERV